MQPSPAVIIAHWETKDVSINGQGITPTGFMRDLKVDEDEPGDNQDILQDCRWVRRFAWGNNSRSTSSLALACCFYLNVSWVMSRFFLQELQHAPQVDLRLSYTEDALQAAYEHCEELFAQEFTVFMKKLGAIELGER
jgi:hypothetical protein